MLLKRITLTPIPAITKINKTQAHKLLKSGKYRDLFMPFILPNVKFTRGDESPDKRLMFQFLGTVEKPGMSATSRRVQRLVRLVVFLEIPLAV